MKADWDTWIHAVRLENNLRHLLAAPEPPMYFGNTLWCSYSIDDYQQCGYGFGPLQACGAVHATHHSVPLPLIECDAMPSTSVSRLYVANLTGSISSSLAGIW